MEMTRREIFRRILNCDEEYLESLSHIAGDGDICLRKAQVSGMKRLLSCLVNEGYLEATMTDGSSEDSASGKFLILKMNGNQNDRCWRYYVKLVAQPITTEDGRVTYLDPDECGTTLLGEDSNKNCFEIRHPVDVMNAVCQFHNVSDETTTKICERVTNSVLNQRHFYLNPPKEPSLSSSILEWEQSILEGHATHPTYRTLYAYPPMASILPSTNLMDATVNFLAVKRDYITVLGPFEDIMRRYLSRLGIDPDDTRLPDKDEFVLFPVHCLQLPHIFLYHRENVRLLPFVARAQAQSAIRTLNLTDFPEFCLKASLAIELVGALRVTSIRRCQIGFKIAGVLEKIEYDRDKLIVANEVASAAGINRNIEAPGHMGAVFRESSEWLIEGRNEYAIPSCALMELNGRGVARVCDVFQLDTMDKKVAWLTSYAQTFFEAFIPTAVQYGVTFEAHSQNTLLRVDKESKAIKGFIIRDMDGIFFHKETLYQSTGITLELPQRDMDSLKTLNFFAYHTHIQNNLNRLIRVMGLHYNGGLGWQILRSILVDLSRRFTKDALNYRLFDDWLRNPKSYLKCYLRRAFENRMHIGSFEELQPNILYINN